MSKVQSKSRLLHIKLRAIFLNSDAGIVTMLKGVAKGNKGHHAGLQNQDRQQESQNNKGVQYKKEAEPALHFLINPILNLFV